MKVFKLIFKNALRHKLRTTLTIVGIAIAVMAFGLLRTVVTAWYVGVEASAANRLITRQAVSFIFPLPYSYRDQIAKIELRLDEATWLPAQQQFYEGGTQDYFTIRYTRVARNVNIPDSRFKPRWPSGTERIKPQS